VSNSSFENNEAKTHGGAITCTRGSNNFTNCTFYGNKTTDAGGLGGAIYNIGDPGSTWFSTIVNCTFANNIAGGYGGAWVITNSQGSVKNTIVANNRAYQQCGYPPPAGCNGYGNGNNCGGALTNNGNNIEYPERPNRVANPNYADPNDRPCFDRPVVLNSNQMPVIDPMLSMPGSNGGPTMTMALMAGSPAINAGDGCSEFDQRGARRVGACDIGAYEYNGVLSTAARAERGRGLLVYPNPAQGEIFLALPQGYEGQAATVQLYSLDGKLLLEKTLEKGPRPALRLTHKGACVLKTTIGQQFFTNSLFLQ